MSKKYTWGIDMHCGGCSGAIKRILAKDDLFPEDAVYCEWEEKVLAVTSDKEDC